MIDATATVRGLVIGAGTPYRITRWPAWVLGTAAVRVADAPRPRRNGAVAGSDLLDARSGAFEVVVLGEGRADCESKLALLSEAFAPDAGDEWLDVRISGNPAEYAFRGRCRGVSAGLGRRFNGAVAEARCTFTATDPVRYGAEVSQVIGLDEHTIPETLPFVLGPHDEGAIIVGGNATVERWTVTFQAPSGGPLLNPRILHIATSQLVRVDATVPANGTLVLDGYAGVAVLGSSIVPTSVSQWFALTPGAQTLRFTASEGTHLSSTATIAWRPGYQ